MGIVAIDLETTGIDPAAERMIEIGAFKPESGEIFRSFINPKRPLPERITALTGITEDMLADAPEETEVLAQLLEFLEGDTVLLGHNIPFDHSFLAAAGERCGIALPEFSGIDTLRIARALLPELKSKSLESLCVYFAITNEHAHRAFEDAKTAYELYECLKKVQEEKGADASLFAPAVLCYEQKKQQPITQKQRSFLNAILAYHKLEQQYSADNLTKSEASKLIDTLLFTYGRIPYRH